MADSVASSVAAHAARNRELVTLISRKGGDLTARRVIDLHFWAPDEGSAGRLADALRAFGVGEVVSNRVESDSSLWNVEGQILASVDQVVADDFVECLVSLARAHQADFDGWGTSL
jgi:regulator of RNase E activity RraB